ncbi:M23 family metallopeptidase [Candidatus Sumerlaeota bacterium]|nr:M23 family metallopeptidase [Candidatus Sumerlaeota bacterium]
MAKKYKRSKTLIAQVNGVNPQKSLQEGWYIFIPPLESSPPKTVSKSAPPSPVPPVASSHRMEKAPEKKQTTPSSKSLSSPSAKASSLQSSASSDNVRASSKGFIWPVSGRVIKEFSDSQSAPHKGIDLSAKKGAIVQASKSGKVIYSGEEIPGYGKLVIIDHEDQISTVYAHNSELLVRVGRYVERGAPIARVGDTGRASESHLHFEIRRKAVCVNPRNYLP